MKNKPEVYWAMLQTAEQVAKRYSISRQAMDEYGASSQQKASAALEKGLFRTKSPHHRHHGCGRQGHGPHDQASHRERRRRHPRGTTYDGIKDLRSALPGGLVSAGNASQLSDGAGATVVMHEKVAEQKGLKPLGRFWALPSLDASPTKWASAPCSPSPKVLKRLGLSMNDIDLWELNEAFAVQVIYCRDKLGIPGRQAQRQRRRHRRGPPLRHERPAPHRPRPHRRQAPWGEAGLRHHVHWRRHGRGRCV